MTTTILLNTNIIMIIIILMPIIMMMIVSLRAQCRSPPSSRLCRPSRALVHALVRGWPNTVETVLFEISNSMKPYPSVVHAYTSKSRPAIGFFEPTNLDEVSNRIPPTSHLGGRNDPGLPRVLLLLLLL